MSRAKKSKCKGLNRKGQRCGSYAPLGSDYCRHHDPRLTSVDVSINARVPLIDRLGPYGKLLGSALFTVLVSWIFYSISPSPASQDQLERWAEREFRETRSDLAQVYNQGYVLFAFDRRGKIIPRDLTGPNVKVDWSGAEVKYDGAWIHVKYPDLEYRGGGLQDGTGSFNVGRIAREAPGMGFLESRIFGSEEFYLVL